MPKAVNNKAVKNDLKIIALIGECNTGKSLTIRNVIMQLINKSANISTPSKYRKMSVANIIADIIRTERTKKGEVSEMTAIFELNGKKILVTTYGDEWKGLEDKFKHNVDLFVCAAHRKFIKDNNGNNLKNATKNGWLITIGRNFYNSPFSNDLIKQKTLQEEQAKFIADEILSHIANI